MKTDISWVTHGDLDRLADLSKAVFGKNGWKRSDFKDAITRNDWVGKIAELDGVLVGYVIYELKKYSYRIISIAVHPEHRRLGVGSSLIKSLLKQLKEKRHKITVSIPEENLQAQVFFRDGPGFRAIKVEKSDYGLKYRMVFDVREEVTCG